MPTENTVPKARTTTGQTKFEGYISVRFPSALLYIKKFRREMMKNLLKVT